MLNKMIDHTLLKPTATEADILALCEEAKLYDFMSVCVNPSHVALAKKALEGSTVLVCTVIGFPLGANTTDTKVQEAIEAIDHGADELDMVINIGKAKAHDYRYIAYEIAELVAVAEGRTVKVILETCFLTDEEKVAVCQAASQAGATFVKTSTGFGSGGATFHDVDLMKASILSYMQVKASGGVRTYEDAMAYIAHGVTRIGTSGGVALMNHEQSKGGY
ncbi:MAG: deoxyribose-phosphate aldolase [Bacilli bacterium]|nr:deoxyribose-phosphate aldolase [Bacilli bacterium]